ncbi:hypothetical protein UlMin_017397 [Ulmus minor]
MLKSSQALVLATAMAVSSAVIFLAFPRQKIASPSNQISENRDSDEQPPEKHLRSCLYSGDKERKKKKVRFEANVKEPRGNGEEFRNRHKKSSRVERVCRIEIPANYGMPANRIALYNGILKNRVHRTECSY